MGLGETSLLGIPASSIGGGQFKDSNGYWRDKLTRRLVHRTVYFDCHPTGHRGWHVHHLNGCKTDNRIENLMLLRPEHHLAVHQHWPMHSLPSRSQILRFLERFKPKKTRPDQPKKRFRRASEKKQKKALKHALNGGQLVEWQRAFPIFKGYTFDARGRLVRPKPLPQNPIPQIIVRRKGQETRKAARAFSFLTEVFAGADYLETRLKHLK